MRVFTLEKPTGQQRELYIILSDERDLEILKKNYEVREYESNILAQSLYSLRV